MGELIELASSIVLSDISEELPLHKTLRYGEREPELIERIWVHHSGKLGKAGKLGPRNSARYSISKPPKSNPKKTVFPGAAYHVWVPYYPTEDLEWALACYRLNKDSTVSWHTGGVNNTGWGICLQGNLNPAQKSGTHISEHQIEILEALLPWARERFNLLSSDTWLSWHSEAGVYGGRAKANCPGSSAEEWLREYREAA